MWVGYLDWNWSGDYIVSNLQHKWSSTTTGNYMGS